MDLGIVTSQALLRSNDQNTLRQPTQLPLRPERLKEFFPTQVPSDQPSQYDSKF
jgi:hypothetical protein